MKLYFILLALTSTLVSAGPGFGTKIHNVSLSEGCPPGTTVGYKYVGARKNDGHSIQILYPGNGRVLSGATAVSDCSAKINLILPRFGGQASFNGVFYDIANDLVLPSPDSSFSVGAVLKMEDQPANSAPSVFVKNGDKFENKGLLLDANQRQWGYCHSKDDLIYMEIQSTAFITGANSQANIRSEQYWFTFQKCGSQLAVPSNNTINDSGNGKKDCTQDVQDWCRWYIANKPNKDDPNPSVDKVVDCDNAQAVEDPWKCEWGWWERTPGLCTKVNEKTKIIPKKQCRYGYTFGKANTGKCVWDPQPSGCILNVPHI
jgi:hypothetical protein